MRIRVSVEVHVSRDAASAEADEHDAGGVSAKCVRVGVQPADGESLVAQAGVRISGAVGAVQ